MKTQSFSEGLKKDINLLESQVRIAATISSVVFMILTIIVQPVTLAPEHGPSIIWFLLSVLPLVFAIAGLFLPSWLTKRRLKGLSPHETDPKVIKLVEEIARKQGLNQAPKTYLITSTRPLCYVIGLRNRDARLVISQGLKETLSTRELEAILSHEIAHIKNRDMWFLNWGKVFRRSMKYWSVAFLVIAFSLWIIRDRTVSGWIEFFYRYLFILLFWVIIPIISINSASRVGESLADAQALHSLGESSHLSSAIKKVFKRIYLDALLMRLTKRKITRIFWDFCHLTWIPMSLAKFTVISSPPIAERINDLKKKRHLVGDKLLLPSKETSVYAGLLALYFFIATFTSPFWGVNELPMIIQLLVPLPIVVFLNTFPMKYSPRQLLFKGPIDREYRSFFLGLFTRNLVSWATFAFAIYFIFLFAYGQLEILAIFGVLFLAVLYSLVSWLCSFWYLIFRRFITRG